MLFEQANQIDLLLVYLGSDSLRLSIGTRDDISHTVTTTLPLVALNIAVSEV